MAFGVNNRNGSVLVHRIQALQKFGDKIFKDGIVVRHLNGEKTDNSWDNIAIGTHKDNAMDIPKEQRLQRSLYATSFVRKHYANKVKKFHSIDKSYKKTMNEFSISSKGTLHFILNKAI